jgi:hypothetical protein
MTLLTPQLALKRLAITCRGVIVYDEKFRYGVNIIRGVNGSGKSTIAEFIFYILGGEVDQFKQEAAMCDSVVAEIEINSRPVILRRLVKSGGKEPVQVFYGEYSSAIASAVEGWQIFSMVRSATKESFSQILFRALDFPEVKTDTENNITMHQVLRMLYVDQLSPVDALLKFETFDPPLIRQTVAAILYGLYDDFLYADLKELRDKKKVLESVNDKLEALCRAVKETGMEVDEKTIALRMEAITSELANIENAISVASNEAIGKVQIPDLKKEIDALSSELSTEKVSLSAAIEEEHRWELEIADSEAFVVELKNRIVAIDESLLTRNAMGELPLTHCPHCLSILKDRGDDKLCVLCGNQLPENPSDSKALRMKQELAQQLKESERLLNDKRQALSFSQNKIPELTIRVRNKQHQYEQNVQKVRPAREAKIDKLFIRKGELGAEIENLTGQAKLVALLKSYESQGAELKSKIQVLEISIQKRKGAQISRLTTAEDTVQKNTLYLLAHDLPRQAEFERGGKLTVDFGKNTFALDGKNQFSASSIVYLKNSVHFGIFFASLDLRFFRYPRFILCDNMEDKGMEQARSQNFQTLIAKLSESSKYQHQIIFTTSMIDPSLNNSKYCVGPEYTKARKTLDFSKLAPTTTGIIEWTSKESGFLGQK